MKKIVIIAIVAVGLAFGYAYAHNDGYMGGYGHHGGGHMMHGGPGAMMGPGMMHGYGGNGGYANCPGWAAFSGDGWNSSAHQQYLEDTAGLRKELHDKRFEYMELRRNQGADDEQLAGALNDIRDITAKLQEKANQYR